MTVADLRPREDLPHLHAQLADLRPRTLQDVRHRRRDGSVIDVEVTLRGVDIGGRRAGLALVRDITEELRLERTHRAAEQQLRQSQKMQAVGQLTGGIAHDFNNMLTVIVGHAEALTLQLPPDSPLRAHCETILRAADSSSDLTSRLLAFARQQPLQPKPIALNEFVARVERLLRRTLGETVAIELRLAPHVWQAMLDPAQLESAILNLAINARDAMPRGGTLTIETANATFDVPAAGADESARRGDFVLVSVSDTGTGIPPEILDRIFEPFFTTKEVGKGTGLGLSMVHGFVRQSGGHVELASEPGGGTSVRMYFPRADVPGDAQVNVATSRAIARARGERVLVVEDDGLVRDNVVSRLTGLGYAVLTADSGPAAVTILESSETIDLVFTDVVMPGGMSGRDLADIALRLRPRIRILFTSGYSANEMMHDGHIAPDVDLLIKPYHLHELAAKLRKVLDERQPVAA